MHVHCARVAALVSGVPAVGFLQSPAAVYIASCFEAGAGSNSGGGGGCSHAAGVWCRHCCCRLSPHSRCLLLDPTCEAAPSGNGLRQLPVGAVTVQGRPSECTCILCRRARGSLPLRVALNSWSWHTCLALVGPPMLSMSMSRAAYYVKDWSSKVDQLKRSLQRCVFAEPVVSTPVAGTNHAAVSNAQIMLPPSCPPPPD